LQGVRFHHFLQKAVQDSKFFLKKSFLQLDNLSKVKYQLFLRWTNFLYRNDLQQQKV